jgi:hypothetical protein
MHMFAYKYTYMWTVRVHFDESSACCKGVFNFCVVGWVRVSHAMHGHVDHDGEGVGHMPS